MDDKQLKKAFRNAWILVAVAAVFSILFYLFTVETNRNAPKPTFDMGGKDFVPASAPYGNGYNAPVTSPEKGGAQ